jgi:hypothetical protein
VGNIQSLFKKWIVKRPKGMCQILFSLTELDNFCDEIRKEIFNEEVLDVLGIIDKEIKRTSKKLEDSGENNGYSHSYAIVKTLIKKE